MGDEEMQWEESRPEYYGEEQHIAIASMTATSWVFRAELVTWTNEPTYKAYVEIDEYHSYGLSRYDLPTMEAAKAACIEMAMKELQDALAELSAFAARQKEGVANNDERIESK